MGGDFRRKSGRNKHAESVYYFCAREFGWTKKQVDDQPCIYLSDLIRSWSDEQRRANLNRKKL